MIVDLKQEISEKRLQELLSLGDELFQSILLTFFDSASEYLRSIHSLQEIQETQIQAKGNETKETQAFLQKLQSITHTLKGSVLNLGFVQLGMQAEQLSKLAKAGDFSAYFLEFVKLEKEFNRLQSRLQSKGT